MTIDFTKTAEDYARHRRAFDGRLFERLLALGVGAPGQRVIDVGAGTGLLGTEFARRGAAVTLVEPGFELLRLAPRHTPTLKHVSAHAERLPFADASFDSAICGNAWHWFDRSIVPLELMRVLRDGGEIAVAYQTYLPLPRNVAAMSEWLILQFRRGWRHINGVGVNGQVLRDLQIGGFINIESFTFDMDLQFTRSEWAGFIRTNSSVGATMTAEELEKFDRAHHEQLSRWPEPIVVPHRVFAVVATRPVRCV